MGWVKLTVKTQLAPPKAIDWRRLGLGLLAVLVEEEDMMIIDVDDDGEIAKTTTTIKGQLRYRMVQEG